MRRRSAASNSPASLLRRFGSSTVARFVHRIVLVRPSQGNKQPAGHAASILLSGCKSHICQGLPPTHPDSHRPILKPHHPKEKYFAPSRKEPVPPTPQSRIASESRVPSNPSQLASDRGSCGDGRIRPSRESLP